MYSELILLTYLIVADITVDDDTENMSTYDYFHTITQILWE